MLGRDVSPAYRTWLAEQENAMRAHFQTRINDMLEGT